MTRITQILANVDRWFSIS